MRDWVKTSAFFKPWILNTLETELMRWHNFSEMIAEFHQKDWMWLEATDICNHQKAHNVLKMRQREGI